MTTLTRDHTTNPSNITAGNQWHTWTVSDGANHLALWALRTLPINKTYLPADAAGLVTDAPSGTFVFDVISTHTHTPGIDSGFACEQHPDCEVDAVVTDVARPAWDLIVASGVTDDAVWAQLERVHGQVFGGAA